MIKADTVETFGPPVSRIASADVYRGFVMLLMMGEVLSFGDVSSALPGNRFWSIVAFNQSHVEWSWLSLHDMIQPSFTFFSWRSTSIFNSIQDE